MRRLVIDSDGPKVEGDPRRPHAGWYGSLERALNNSFQYAGRIRITRLGYLDAEPER